MPTLLARNWWALAIRGALGIIFGVIALLMPGITLKALVLLFGAYSLVDGIFEIIAGVRAAREGERWWPLVLAGLAGIVAGIIAFVAPIVAALALLYLVAAWAIVTGVLEVVAAIRLRQEIEGEWLLILKGIITILFGVLLIVNPVVGLITLVWWIGISAIVFGVVLLILAFRLKGHTPPTSTTQERPARA
ncbi:MAG: HdeD family acid-resistance protein [Candidatus Rokubacteria bacterium]|nr:HdeD family acid-resistance protein [Candidatus Rokubacteria bacterium]